MQVTVELQDNYSYIPLILLVLVTAVIICLLIVWAGKEKKAEKKVKPEEPVQVPVNPRSRAMDLKRKYDRELICLEDAFDRKDLSERDAYQKLSRLVRDFAHEMTGVKVQNYTLQELRSIGMPQLTALIEECYVPEFALGNQSDVSASIKKARKVISEWI